MIHFRGTLARINRDSPMPRSPARCRRRVSVLALALVVTACSSDPSAISVEMKTDKVDRDLVERALGVFKQACAPLFTAHAGDVSGLSAVATDEGSTAIRRLGWGAYIALTMTVRASPTTLSGLAETDRRADFLIGGGDKPGFTALSPTSARLCDLGPAPGRTQVFQSVPELGGLLPRLKYATTDAQRAQWSAEMAKALAGVYQYQRNIAWCYTDGCYGVEPIDDVKACAWRMVILAAKHPKADASDAENVDFDCKQTLTPDDQRTARAWANTLFRKIYKTDLPKGP